MLESAYAGALALELSAMGIQFLQHPVVPVEWKGVEIGGGLRPDFLIDRCLVVELKAVEQIADVHLRQTRTYTQILNYRLGLLINFGALRLKDGIRRVANGMPS